MGILKLQYKMLLWQTPIKNNYSLLNSNPLVLFYKISNKILFKISNKIMSYVYFMVIHVYLNM